MKRVLLLVFFLIFLSSGLSIKAQETDEKLAAEKELAQRVDSYQLPYPGLLPDNPLYPVKMVRDQVIRVLIGDSLKKAEFDLLTAEKRFSAGMALLEQSTGKETLAQSTLSKGQNYFEDAIESAIKAEKEGQEIAIVAEHLFLSAKKQKKIVAELQKKQKKEQADVLKNIAKRLGELEKKVDRFSKK